MNNIFIKQNIAYARQVAETVSAFGGGPLGFRNAGSEAEHYTARYIEKEMRKIGLCEVVRETFPVDTWAYRRAALTYPVISPAGEQILATINLAPFAAGGTSVITAELVFAGRGTRHDCDQIDVTGKIALIDIDMRDEWWVNYPAYQLAIRGAVAVIVNSVSGYAEICDDAYITQDFCGTPEIPVFSVTVRTAGELKALISASNATALPYSVTIDADNPVTSGGKSYNVSGKIIGCRHPEELIVVSAHYDAHFTGFQDDAAAVGQILAMAKAMIEADSPPARTFIFIAHGAEEWGAIDTRYDWCIGAWNQVFRLHPEWTGSAAVNLNFEMTALSLQNAVRSTPELVSFINDVTANECEVLSPLRTWSDDFSYSIAGIPSLVNAFDRFEFLRAAYHTNFDTPELWNDEAMYRNLIFYGALATAFDETEYLPINFSHRFASIKESLIQPLRDPQSPESIATNDTTEKIIIALDELIADSIRLYSKLRSVAPPIFLTQINKSLLAIYKRLQDDFVRLNWFAEPIFEHEYYKANIDALSCAIDAVNQSRSPVEHLITIDESYYDLHFDREVVRRFKSPDQSRLFWGTGRQVDSLDLFDIINAEISPKSDNALLAKLHSLLDDQRAKYDASLLRVSASLDSVKAEISRLLCNLG